MPPSTLAGGVAWPCVPGWGVASCGPYPSGGNCQVPEGRRCRHTLCAGGRGGGGGVWEGDLVALGTSEPQAVSATAPMHAQKYCVSAVPIQSLKWLAMGTRLHTAPTQQYDATQHNTILLY